MQANGPVRVLGGAGTGKTVVAMHRAKFLAEQIFNQPGDKIWYCPSFSLMDFIRQGKQGLDLGQLIRELSWYPIG